MATQTHDYQETPVSRTFVSPDCCGFLKKKNMITDKIKKDKKITWKKITLGEIDSEFCLIKPNFNCKTKFPILLTSRKIPFDAKSIG